MDEITKSALAALAGKKKVNILDWDNAVWDCRVTKLSMTWVYSDADSEKNSNPNAKAVIGALEGDGFRTPESIDALRNFLKLPEGKSPYRIPPVLSEFI